MGRGESLQALEGELGNLVRRVRHMIAERARAVHPDLHVGRYWIFAMIARSGPMRASAIAEDFHLDKGAVSRQVQHLLELGLVERSQDPADGRAQLLQVTSEGRRRLEAAQQDQSADFAQRLSAWSQDEIEELTRALSRFNSSMGATGTE